MTAIRIQGEKQLVPPPSPYKHTSIGKRQVTIIRLLQTLQRHYLRHQDPTPIVDRLRGQEVLYELSEATLPDRIKEEKLYLRQIQHDIDIHRDEHLQTLAYKAHMAAKTEEAKDKI